MSMSEQLGLLGRKVGMMRIFTDDGDAIPVTVLDVSNNRVTQVKTADTDGYNALQVAFGARKASRVTKPEAGHLAKAGVEAGDDPARNSASPPRSPASTSRAPWCRSACSPPARRSTCRARPSARASRAPSSATTSARSADPVHYVEHMALWLVTRHDDVKRLLSDSDLVTPDKRAWEFYDPRPPGATPAGSRTTTSWLSNATTTAVCAVWSLPPSRRGPSRAWRPTSTRWSPTLPLRSVGAPGWSTSWPSSPTRSPIRSSAGSPASRRPEATNCVSDSWPRP